MHCMWASATRTHFGSPGFEQRVGLGRDHGGGDGEVSAGSMSLPFGAGQTASSPGAWEINFDVL